jgi:hypothetical protein
MTNVARIAFKVSCPAPAPRKIRLRVISKWAYRIESHNYPHLPEGVGHGSTFDLETPVMRYGRFTPDAMIADFRNKFDIPASVVIEAYHHPV